MCSSETRTSSRPIERTTPAFLLGRKHQLLHSHRPGCLIFAKRIANRCTRSAFRSDLHPIACVKINSPMSLFSNTVARRESAESSLDQSAPLGQPMQVSMQPATTLNPPTRANTHRISTTQKLASFPHFYFPRLQPPKKHNKLDTSDNLMIEMNLPFQPVARKALRARPLTEPLSNVGPPANSIVFPSEGGLLKKIFAVAIVILAFTAAPSVKGQGGRRQAGSTGPAAGAPTEATEEGIPVTDPLVISKCGTCHQKDEKGNLARISWERATPEGWEEAIKRMVRLNGLTITPAEARSIVKYLATYHGLAPEEAKPVMYMAEHRMHDETHPERYREGRMHATATRSGAHCPGGDRKTIGSLLTNMHVALYAQAEAAFRRDPNGGGGGSALTPLSSRLRPVRRFNRSKRRSTFLGKSAPLHTPEWAAWRARMRAPKLAGRWLVSAEHSW